MMITNELRVYKTIKLEEDNLDEIDVIGLLLEKYNFGVSYNKEKKTLSIPTEVIEKILKK